MGRKKKTQTSIPLAPSATTEKPIDETASPSISDSELKDNAARLKAEIAESKEEKEGKEKGSYRSKKLREEEERKRSEVINAAKGFQNLVSMGLEILVPRMPNPLPLTEFEKEGINKAVQDVMVKYIPAIDKWKEEAVLLGCMALFILPRMKAKRKPVPNLTVLET